MGYPIVFLGVGKTKGVKLCFETTEATNYLLEAHDRKEVEISSKHLLKTYSVPATPIGVLSLIRSDLCEVIILI